MDSVVLEIAIGLVLVFAIAAAAASAVNEIVTRLFNVRSKALWARLDELLSGADHKLGIPFLWTGLFCRSVRPIRGNPVIAVAPSRPAAQPPAEGRSLAERLLGLGAGAAASGGRSARGASGPPPVAVAQDPLTRATGWFARIFDRKPRDAKRAQAQARLQTLAQTGAVGGLDYVKLGHRSKVSEIPGKVFANALVELAQAREGDGLEARVRDLAQEYQQPDQGLLAPLGAFLATTGAAVAHDTDKLLAAAETWFDGQMQVLSSTYKRNAKWALGAIGVVIAILFNVNAIAIAGGLNDNAAFRQAAVTAADGVSAGEFPACVEAGEGDEGGSSDQDSAEGAATVTTTVETTVAASGEMLEAATPGADPTVQPTVGTDSESGGETTTDPYADLGCAVQQFRVFSEAGLIVPGDEDYFTLFGDAWDGVPEPASSASPSASASPSPSASPAAGVEGEGDAAKPPTQPRQMDFWGQLAGIALTGLATALGGPFWFDLMKQLTGLRKGR
ncbi:hypothetical protein [Demequina gelatinilytica]|uniref:hypothetical protein n=1 Tax=Demequina gelatinilytica TaxID=1638980 RepID=UPI0007823772|nr:hypothetical protein [Demequina gelatinilytica]